MPDQPPSILLSGVPRPGGHDELGAVEVQAAGLVADPGERGPQVALDVIAERLER